MAGDLITEIQLIHAKDLPKQGAYWKMTRGYTFVRIGKREKAMEFWNELEVEAENGWVNPCHRGMMVAYLGFTDSAFELLIKMNLPHWQVLYTSKD